jgi:hypothetical protein
MLVLTTKLIGRFLFLSSRQVIAVFNLLIGN